MNNQEGVKMNNQEGVKKVFVRAKMLGLHTLDHKLKLTQLIPNYSQVFINDQYMKEFIADSRESLEGFSKKYLIYSPIKLYDVTYTEAIKDFKLEMANKNNVDVNLIELIFVDPLKSHYEFLKDIGYTNSTTFTKPVELPEILLKYFSPKVRKMFKSKKSEQLIVGWYDSKFPTIIKFLNKLFPNKFGPEMARQINFCVKTNDANLVTSIAKMAESINYLASIDNLHSFLMTPSIVSLYHEEDEPEYALVCYPLIKYYSTEKGYVNNLFGCVKEGDLSKEERMEKIF